MSIAGRRPGENGYFVTGVGKIFHPHKPVDFDMPWSWSARLEGGGVNESMPFFHTLDTMKNCLDPAGSQYLDKGGTETGKVWCQVPASDETWMAGKMSLQSSLMDSVITFEAQRRLDLIHRSKKNFYLAVGWHRPHTPYRVPAHFYDMYPVIFRIACLRISGVVYHTMIIV